MNLSRKPRGSVPIIIIIILLILAVLLAIWYAFWGKPKAQAPPPPSPSTSAIPVAKEADPYDGWKSYTLKYEKFSFKYPADWKLADTSTKDEGGSDKVTVLSPDGFEVTIWSNMWGIGGNCEDCKAFETTQVKILGETTGENIYGGPKGAAGIGLERAEVNGKMSYECIGLCAIPGKNTNNALAGGKPGLVMIHGSYKVATEAEAMQLGTTVKYYPYNTFKADPNVATARLIFASMTY